MTKNKLDYKLAGVDINAGNEAVDLIKDSVKSTFSKNVLIGLGGFGALYDLKSIIKKLSDQSMKLIGFGSLNWKKNHTLPIIFLFLTTMYAVTLKLLRGLRNITVIALIILIFLLLKIYMALKRLNRS